MWIMFISWAQPSYSAPQVPLTERETGEVRRYLQPANIKLRPLALHTRPQCSLRTADQPAPCSSDSHPRL